MPKTHVLQLLNEREHPDVICQRLFADPFIADFVLRFGDHNTSHEQELTQKVLNTCFSAYLGGVNDLEEHRAEKEDNRSFEKVVNRSRQLREAIEDIVDSPTATRKFIAAVQHYDRFEEGSTPRILLDWSRSGHNGLTRLLSDFLVDVEIAAENAQNKKPFKQDVTPQDERDNFWFDDSETDGEFAQRLQEWKGRSQAHNLQKITHFCYF